MSFAINGVEHGKPSNECRGPYAHR